MSEETRIATLLVAARKAVRHFVPLSQIQRLAKLQMDMDDAAASTDEQIRSLVRFFGFVFEI